MMQRFYRVNVIGQLWNKLRLVREEVRQLDIQAERDRLNLGYQRVPLRVWHRRSALFLDY